MSSDDENDHAATTTAVPDDDFTTDVGSLLLLDHRPFDATTFARLSGDAREEYLCNLARDNSQRLIDAVWQCPVDVVEDEHVAKLPARTFMMPREKPVPVAKAQTRWEKFAVAKGIQKRKRSRMEFDDATQEYTPRYGYGSVANQGEEVPWIVLRDQDDPYTDKFEEKGDSKKKRVAKNKAQQLRNLAERRDVSRKSTSFAGKSAVKDALGAALNVSRTATASVGKFDAKLKGEPKVAKKHRKKQNLRNPVAGGEQKEKQRALSLLAKMDRKQVTISTQAGIRAADSGQAAMVSFGSKKSQNGKSKSKSTGPRRVLPGQRPERISAKGPSKKQKKNM